MYLTHKKPNPDKKMIPLSIGDPSVFGNFPAPREAAQVILKSHFLTMYFRDQKTTLNDILNTNLYQVLVIIY